jgi:hypothetical protein
MTTSLIESDGHRILALSPSGTILRNIRDLTDIIGEALAQQATVIVAPVERLDSTFFQLGSGVAGAFLQKIVNYRLQVAVIGEVSSHSAKSAAWRDFVKEANRGRSIFFLPDLDAILAKLSSLSSAEEG